MRTHDSTSKEAGFSLVELMFSMLVFSFVIASVYMSISVLTQRMDGLSNSNQAIDQLQVAEQNVTAQIHALSSWTLPPCTPTSPATTCTTTSLSFAARLYGVSNNYNIQIVNHSLQVSKNAGAYETLVTNLDPSSIFTVSEPVNGYYTSVSVTLTVDSPRVNAPQEQQTTVADPTVEAWNIEYNCVIATGAKSC